MEFQRSLIVIARGRGPGSKAVLHVEHSHCLFPTHYSHCRPQHWVSCSRVWRHTLWHWPLSIRIHCMTGKSGAVCDI